MREQFFGNIEQFLHARAAARGDEAHRHQMAFAQALLEGVVQLLAAEAFFAHFEKMVHHAFVDLDHLVDDALMPSAHRADVAVAAAVAEAIDHRFAAVGWQIQRQHFIAEGLAQFVEQRRQLHALVIDLVDHDHAAQLAALGVLHHPSRAVANAGVGIHHHRERFHRRQRRQCGAAKIGIAGGVDQIDVDQRLTRRGVVDAGDGIVDGMAAFFLDRIVIGDGGAAFDVACRLKGAAGMQQGFE